MPFWRKYNTLLVTGTTAIRIPIIKRGVVDFAVGADWTPVAGDVKVMVDGAAVANITNLPTAIAAGNGAYWEFILTAAELSCKQLLVTIVDAATKAIEDQSFIVETYGNASAMYAADLSLANLPANVTQLLGTAWLTPAVAGTPDVNAKQLGGTAQTGRDIGASVLLSNGTGAGQISLSAGAVTVGTNNDKTGYSLTQAFPANFSVLSISATTGLVDITQTAADKVWSTTARTITGGTITTNSDKTGYAIGTGGITNTSFAANAVDAAALATDAVNEIWSKVVESQGSYTAQQVMSIILAVLSGITAGGGATLKTPNGIATRVAATIDGSNNRTAMTLTPSA